MAEVLRNPYVGPRPFEDGETLYGRGREERELFHKLKARRIVLLHSPSGAGKSSLVQAALRPRLTSDRFDVWPTVRLNLEPSFRGNRFNTARIWSAESGEVIHKLEGHFIEVYHTAWSDDGGRVLTASADSTARIWAVGGTEHLQGRIRAEIRDKARRCLPVDFRQQTLDESPEEAERHFAACEACVPGFFDRLEGVPRGAVEPYVEAWREYRACLDDRLGG